MHSEVGVQDHEWHSSGSAALRSPHWGKIKLGLSAEDLACLPIPPPPIIPAALKAKIVMHLCKLLRK